MSATTGEDTGLRYPAMFTALVLTTIAWAGVDEQEATGREPTKIVAGNVHDSDYGFYKVVYVLEKRGKNVRWRKGDHSVSASASECGEDHLSRAVFWGLKDVIDTAVQPADGRSAGLSSLQDVEGCGSALGVALFQPPRNERI